ncbi:MAG: hypothetical protein M1817_006250 [Caeruleum heppii]|nr:MAG: hypothetical protein M1817_006250 [Caeruleum heppii]
MLSSLLISKARPPGWKARRHSSRSSSILTQLERRSSDGLRPIFIDDGSNLGEPAQDPPDLRRLNESLAALVAVFPDLQVEVLREMLATFAEESRLEVVTEALLKHKAKWTRGRWRILPATSPAERRGEVLSLVEKFRTEDYKEAVKSLLYDEFRGLSRSSINAVLAEHNYSYTLARPTLLDLSSRSWRFSLTSWFVRRKGLSTAEANEHPRVSWRVVESTGESLQIPMLRSTGSVELDRELVETLIRPLRRSMREEQDCRDHEMATVLNEAEAEEQNALHECQCCFSSVTFEQVSTCDQSGHFICFNCIRHAVNEAVFGQGWHNNIDVARGTLRCIVPVLDGSGDCHGCVLPELVKRALLQDQGGKEVFSKFEERLATEGLLKSKVPLVHCPFCTYAEVDDILLSPAVRKWRFRRSGVGSLWGLSLLVLLAIFTPLLLFLLLVSCLICLLNPAHTTTPFASLFGAPLSASLTRLSRRNRGLRFTCLSPSCSLSSCLLCAKLWTDIHICFESERLALRAHVESAMSHAVKRTCPRCHLSFIKASGCNKLTCVCGYHMCYVCRREIGEKEGYRHFCEHFRPEGRGKCGLCDKCDLYHAEDEEGVVRRARERAEKEWKEKEGVGKSMKMGSWQRQETNDMGGRDNGFGKTLSGFFFGDRREGRWTRLLDAVVEKMVEVPQC